jgi:uncharacterized phage protein gp47/JayE
LASIPTITEIKEQILSDIETATGKTAPLLPISVWSVISTALSGALYLIYKYIDYTKRQIFVSTADYEGLILKGQEYGLFPNVSQEWRGTATITGTNGTNIPIGKIYTRGNFAYQVTELATISSGSATLILEALTSGSESNLIATDILTESNPTVGLISTITIASITQSGRDEESIENFRNRISVRQKLPPQGGSVNDYILWTLEVPGISEAFPFLDSPGIIFVYPLLETDDPTARIPDNSKLQEVEDYLLAYPLRPLNSNINVATFTEITINVAVSNLQVDTPALRQTIQDEISDYFYQRRPLLFPNDPEPKNNISVSECITIATLAGAKSLGIVLTASGKTFPYSLDDSELAKPGTFSWS